MLCEGLLIRSIVCEYERNPSRNEEAMANAKVFFTFLLVFDLEISQPEGQCQV